MKKIFKLVIGVDGEKITISAGCHKDYGFIVDGLMEIVSDFINDVRIDIKEVYDEREHD